ncbi:MAG: hypothetical protein IIZ33_06915 [Erysipelotrichaceae bacterium]|nr:hypothetical protein [Erysipelotrichaceae bacterium]
MRKLLAVFLCLLLLGCSPTSKTEADPNIRYLDMIQLIEDYDAFETSSNTFDIAAEEAKIDGGYRFYVIIDNARSAMYDLEAIAIEANTDYTKTMAANIGIFEEKAYNLIPNQANTAKGYYEGVVVSGTTQKNPTTLYVIVQWKNKDLSVLHREFFKLETSYNGAVIDEQ